MADNPSYLPVVEKDGVKCYYYSVERGETVYGITNKFNWDTELFMHYNPDAVGLKGGMVVYYPCETPAAKPAKGNDVPYEKPARLNVQAVSAPAGEPVSLKAEIANMASSDIRPEFYTVKAGEGLADVARNARMSLYGLFKANPGLMPDNLEAGERLLVYPGSDMAKAQLRDVTERKIAGYKKLKVKQNDTWYSIAKKNRLDTTQLMSANPAVVMLRKGEKILIPQYKDTLVTKWMPVIDSREGSATGIAQIYDEVHTAPFAVIGTESPAIEVAVLVACDDVSDRRRDLEFLKGFMLGLQGKTYPGIKVNLKGIDMADYGGLDRTISSGQLDHSDIVICAVDKDFPQALTDYCRAHGKTLVNVFDAKTDLSGELASGIQLLPPSEYFYDRTSDFLTRVMNDRTFIFVGSREGDVESISAALLERLRKAPNNNVVMLANSSDLASYPFNPAYSYVVVSDAGLKDDIMATLKDLEVIVDKYPNMPLSIVGRPNWMVYSSSLETLFRKLDTYLPSRFVFNDDAPESKQFTEAFKSYYNASPLRSMPMYSVMGYDVANYFVEQYVRTKGDLNRATPATGALQLDFRLGRDKKYEGLMNRRVYLLHFTPFSTTETISL